MTNLSARSLRASMLLVLLAILTLGACSPAASAAESDRGAPSQGAGGGTEPGGGDDPLPVEPDFPIGGPVEPMPPDTGPSDGATHVTPVPGIENPIPHAIDHISVGADGRTVTVYWWGGVEACYGLAEVRVERDADGQLVITVFEGTRPALGDFACIEIALLKATTITLDEPLFLDGSQS